jgi:hypothetical protein
LIIYSNSIGQIEIYNWIKEKSQGIISLTNEIISPNDYGKQVLSIIKMNSNLNKIFIIVQMRNGIIIICELINITLKIISDFASDAESFTKISSFCINKRIIVLLSSINCNELSYINFNQVGEIFEKERGTFNLKDEITVADEDPDEESSKSDGLVCVLSCEDEIPFIVVGLESSSKLLIYLIYRINYT